MKNPWKKYSKVNPQRENGNRQIANDVYQALISSKFLGAEYKLIFAVISKTWGFNKPSDAISIKQFQELTNLKRRTIQSTLKKLKRQRVLYSAPSKVRAQTGSPLNSFLFNKHYDTWKVEGCKVDEGCNIEHPPKSDKGAKECKTRVHQVAPTKESITKESIKEKKEHIVEQPVKNQIPYQEIIKYLNQKANKHFKHTNKETQNFIKARWNQGFGLDAFKFVIDIKCKKWLTEPKMIDYLRPQTLFGTKFESYLNETTHPLHGKVSDKTIQSIEALNEWEQKENEKQD